MRPVDDPAVPHEQRAYLGLRDLLLAGEIAPGERLNEVRLAQRLAMSRTPIRWALIELEHIGLVQALAGGGFVARRFSPAEVADAMLLRGGLEGLAARWAAESGISSATADAFGRLLAQGAQLVQGTGIDAAGQRAFAAMNEQFHALLARAAGNEALLRAIDHNNRLPFAAPSAMLPVNDDAPDTLFWLRSSQAQHEALVQAILARQGSRAQHLAEEHARVGRRGLDRVLRTPERLHQLWPAMAKTPSTTASTKE